LDVQELENAERAIIQVVQTQGFDDELLSLKGAERNQEVKQHCQPSPCPQHPVCWCRLENSPIQERLKHPAILPNDHHTSHLIMSYYHSISGHSKLKHTLHQREILDYASKSFALSHPQLLHCCRKRQAAVGQQKLASLPADRVALSELPLAMSVSIVLGH